MESYEVVHPVLKDGERYMPGDTVELTKKQAAELRAIGAIVAPAPPVTPTKKTSGKGPSK